jgi:hypothetical protein
VREFEEKVTGTIRTWRLLDQFGASVVQGVLIGSDKFDREHPIPDLEDLLGRPMLPIDPRDEESDPDDEGADEADMLEDARETAEVLEGDGLVRRGRYTSEQLAAMHRGDPVS